MRRLLPILCLAVLAACGHLQESPAPSTAQSSPVAGAWEECVADAWTVSYPSGWLVHPGDGRTAVGGCELFAAEEFAGEPEPDWGWSGAQIVIRTQGGCRGTFERVVSEDATDIDGRPASRRVLQPAEGGAGQEAVEYLINLSDPVPCETSEWLYARTESDDPGDFDENVAILDQMMRSLVLRSDR